MHGDSDLEELDEKLHQAVRLLDECSSIIVQSGFAPERNAKRIFDALWEVFALQREIYDVRPDLIPEALSRDCGLDDRNQ